MSRIKELSSGFGHIKKGFGFFRGHKRLWWYAIIPTLINLLVLALMIALLIHYYSDLTSWIFGSDTAGGITEMSWLAKSWHYILAVLIYIAKTLIFIILLLFLMVLTFVFSMILAEPFNDLLSEKTEQIATGKDETPLSWQYIAKSIRRSIIVGLQKAAFFLAIPLLLLVLNVIPAVGSIIYLILAGLFAAFDIGFNFIDYPMSRKLWTFSKRMKMGWKNRYQLVGFGIVALIPLFAYIFAAPMVVGGTLLFEETCENSKTQIQNPK